MLLISCKLIDNVQRYKAPKGMMYHIDNILYSDLNASGDTIKVYEELLGDERIDNSLSNSGLISTMVAVNQITFQHRNLDHKTKFITITKHTTGSVDVNVFVFGELVSSSKIELMIEWFRKGR